MLLPDFDVPLTLVSGLLLKCLSHLTSEESNPRAAAGTVSFGRNWPLAASPGPGTSPRGEEMAGRSSGTDSQDLATILDPFQVIFVDLGPDRLSAT